MARAPGTLHHGRTAKPASGGTASASDNDARSDKPRTRRADMPARVWKMRVARTAAAGRVETWEVGVCARFTTTSGRDGRAGLTAYERGCGNDRSSSGSGVRRSRTRMAVSYTHLRAHETR